PVYAIEAEKKLFSKTTYQEVPAGIELQKNLLVHFNHSDELDDIIKAAAEGEIYDLVKVDYFIDDREAIVRDLKKRCKSYLDEEVAFYRDLGIRLDTADRALSFAESVVYPLERYRSFQASSQSKLKGSKASAGVEQVRQPNTMYYHALPDRPYEVVINPEIREPVVQYVYSLRVRFTFPPPKSTPSPQIITEVQREREFIVLTPDGQTRTLDLRKED
ncbi:MAG: SIMPL domain-containing protein, partial [Bacteroidota bacterium]